jgi:hypothetical protein
MRPIGCHRSAGEFDDRSAAPAGWRVRRSIGCDGRLASSTIDRLRRSAGEFDDRSAAPIGWRVRFANSGAW